MGWGGQEIRIIRESEGMIKRGHRIIIAAPKESIINQKAHEAGFLVFDNSFSKSGPLSIWHMRIVLKNERVDVLNTHSSKDSWVATMAARSLKNRPVIIRTRHLSTPISKSFTSKLIYDTMTDAVMTTGEEIRRQMIEDNGFNPDKIFSVPTGADVDKFNPDTVSPSITHNGPKIGMVSVLRSWKGHEYFIKAAPDVLNKFPDAMFYIAGDGPQRENIINLIASLGLSDKIILLGHRDDVPGIMKSLDILVHPSYAGEGVPQSLLQALSMRVPVIASDAGAIKEIIINNQTGYLIRPKDSGAIADKIISLCGNPGLGRSFGEAGRSLVIEKYSFNAMLDRIESLYADLLNRHA